MEIERINENTVKFFLSYIDIEERGFTREEVWYNRDKSEELFWDMMDEINEEAEFEAEGPLWIQVHAKNNGIEVTVTRTNVGEDGLGDPPLDPDNLDRILSNSSSSAIPDNIFEPDDIPGSASRNLSEWRENTFVFNDIEDIILLSSRMDSYDVETVLYAFEDQYYLHVIFDEALDAKQKLDMLSVISEFGAPSSDMTIHRLKEYGVVVMESDVFNQINKYF